MLAELMENVGLGQRLVSYLRTSSPWSSRWVPVGFLARELKVSEQDIRAIVNALVNEHVLERKDGDEVKLSPRK